MLDTIPEQSRFSLATQFAMAGGVVMLVSMLVVGSWVSGRIEETVVRNSANATAQYMESFLSPLSQDLDRSDTLSPGALRALDEVFTNTPLAERVVAYKIWKPGGLVVDASDASLIGQRFPVSDHLSEALKGAVVGSVGDPYSDASVGVAISEHPLLEIYSPIREVWSGRIVGVAEFYEVADGLAADLIEARQRSWLTVALLMMTIGALLYAIVLRGSQTIDRQRVALTRQLAALRDLSDRNNALRLRVQEASARTSAMNDQSLRQIGADLHDGPAQLMAFAALRLDDLRPVVSGQRAQDDLDQVERAVKDAIREIRTISRGLSLPDIEARSPCEVLRNVVDAHAARSGTEVLVDCEDSAVPPLSPAVKICLYRFVQEGLNNAWRHADGRGQAVRLSVTDARLTLSVSDQGPGFPDLPAPATASAAMHEDDGGLGLGGLRDRVESLGGTFEMRNRLAKGDLPGGAELLMTLDIGRP